MTDRPVADREPLSRKEVRRLAVEAFIDAHYEVRCDGALELAWYEAHPEQAAAIVAALRAAQPEDDGLPDERAVATWPGGGGRVSHDFIDGAWFNDADGAWVVLFAPRQFFDGLRRLSESSEGVERRDGA